MAKKKGKRFKQKLEETMFSYFDRLNEDVKVRDKKSKQEEIARKNQQVLYKWAFFIALTLSITVSFLLYLYLHLPGGLWFFILFGITFMFGIILADVFVTKNEARNKDNIKILFEIITLLVLVGQFVVMVNQSTILSQQTSILDRSSSPNQASIEIIEDKSDLKISALEMVRSNELNKKVEERWARIKLTFLNFGQMETSELYCFEKHKSDSISVYINPPESGDFSNIAPLSHIGAELHVKYSECYEGNEKMCDKPELVPTGNYTVSLECECYGCKDQRIFEKNISICIWQNNEREC
ncbi:MAG: hypothetical protein AABW89_01225 [Nanoarchaeota archaeon]